MIREKTFLRRAVTAVLAVIMLLSGAIPAYAANFNTNYTLSGTAADKVVAIASAQAGRSKSDMGYTTYWCASFVSDTAAKAGESAAVPYNAGCRQLYNAIINAGGVEVASPQKGDIVFFVCTKCKVSGYNNAFSHVGIMVDSSGTCISGNYNGRVTQHPVGNYGSEPHSVASGDVILKYVRPNYTGGSTPAPAPQPSAGQLTVSPGAVSIQSGKSTPVTFKVNRADRFNVGVETADSSVCSVAWNSDRFQGSGSSWSSSVTLTGLKAGTTTLTVKLYDDKYSKGTLLDTKTVKVTVTPDPNERNWCVATWISEKGKGYQFNEAEQAKLKQGKAGQIVYFWFKAFDRNSGTFYNAVEPSANYNSNMTVTDPDGKTISCDYKSSDNNWYGFKPTRAGTYKCTVTFTGDLQGSSTLNFPVTEDKPVITPSKTALTVEAGKSVTCNVSVIPNGGASSLDATPANGSVCSISWGEPSRSNGAFIAPMIVTGLQAGTTPVDFYVMDGNKNRLASIPISVTVTAPVSPPTVKLSKNTLEVYAGEKGTVQADFQLNGTPCSADFTVKDSRVCAASWNGDGADSRTLSIAGLTAGSTSVTVALKDGSGKVLASQDVGVSVKTKSAPKPTPKPLSLSVSPDSITMQATSIPRPLDISWSGTVPQNSQIVISSQGSAAHAAMQSKGTASRRLLIYADELGVSTFDICIKNKLTGEILARKNVTVTVADQPEVSLAPSQVTLEVGESKTIRADISGITDESMYYMTYDWVQLGNGAEPASVHFADSGDGLSVTGQRPGSGTLEYQIYSTSSQTPVATARCYITVSSNIVDDISPTPAGDWYAVAAAVYANSSIIEDDIEASDDDGGGSGGTDTQYAPSSGPNLPVFVFPPQGYEVSGSIDLSPSFSTGVKPSGSAGGITMAPAGGSTGTEAEENTVPIAPGSPANPSASQKPGVPAASSSAGGDASSGQDASVSFTDVPSGEYYHEPVMWAQAVGVTSGIKGTTLVPNGNCPRGQVVEFIWRAMGCPEPQTTENPFTDVSAGDSCYKAVLWAYETEVTSGTTKTEFSPAATCTRGQVMTFLWRAQSKPSVSGSTPFTDVASGAYYANAVNWAVAEDIAKGTSTTTFSPNDLCSRAQILTFLYRCIAWSKT